MNIAKLGLAAIFAVGIAGTCVAQDLKATQRFGETQIGFDLGASYNNYTLTVTGPNGFTASASSKAGSPAIDLRRFGAHDDGIYNYHLTASSDEKVTVRIRTRQWTRRRPDHLDAQGRFGERTVSRQGRHDREARPSRP